MNGVFTFALSRGCILRSQVIDDVSFYWLESPHFKSQLCSDINEIVTLLRALPPLPDPDDTLFMLVD
jgi:hypothetical protein